MSADPTDPMHIVRGGYDAIGEAYRGWSSRSPTRLRFVHRVLDRLPDGSTVVDLGCGPGDPATRLLANRHRVLGVDLSPVQVGLARRVAPSASFVVADMTRFALRAASVDAVVSCYALGHVPAERHRPLLTAVAGWLRPGGLFVANAPPQAAEGIESSWLGVPMFFGAIGAEATLAAVADAGLVVESAERVPEDEGAGTIVEFLWVTATKPVP